MLLAQSHPTLCHHTDCSPPGSSVHRILQAGILEWVAISFSMESSWPRDLNPGLLNCRQILYHLSHQGNAFRGMVNITYSFVSLLILEFLLLMEMSVISDVQCFLHCVWCWKTNRGSKWLHPVHTFRWRVSSHCCVVFYKSVCAWSWFPFHLYCCLLSQHLVLSPELGCSQAKACRRIWSFKR